MPQLLLTPSWNAVHVSRPGVAIVTVRWGLRRQGRRWTHRRAAVKQRDDHLRIRQLRLHVGTGPCGQRSSLQPWNVAGARRARRERHRLALEEIGVLASVGVRVEVLDAKARLLPAPWTVTGPAPFWTSCSSAAGTGRVRLRRDVGAAASAGCGESAPMRRRRSAQPST